jgi:hypothetical protein
MDLRRRVPTSETRIAIGGGDGNESIEHALSQAEAHVARMAPSPATEHLQSALESLRRTVDSWRATPAGGEEVARLRAQVTSVLQLARTTSPTMRVRRFG